MLPIRLHIVADDPLVRAGLARLLDSLDECAVVAQSGSTELLQDAAEADQVETADLILWDLGWDGDAALPAWETVDAPIIALAAADVDAAALWNAGVTGLLPRDAAPERLLAAAQAVMHGLSVFDAAAGLAPGADGPLDDAPPLEELTPREAEVLNLLAEGLTNKAIAQALQISSHTVKFHVNAIMSKLNAQSRTAAVVRATRLGLLSL